MFLLKRNLSLSTSDLKEIKDFFSRTIEKMLTTKDETLNVLKRYDMVLICSWEGSYLVMDVFQLSKFAISNRKNVRRHNIPYYVAARSFDKSKETIVYLDEHKEKGMAVENLQAFYHIRDLLNTLEVHVVSANEYECIW
ncbi:hypothetical protein [Planomicrobium sp. CPCC 101079]|uniref:hypothetical protein n=1 Tax=Planomicrobium sp. CPCC 101079 TaxID=2599618 RepID=UPI0011B5FA6C|nr:hypothetical protein [Planomicrobium sp. CPCC 101079]TWT00124.1 hypothetical protein FQV28_18560 [Planomicrobium sp. CPCC 101079]